METDQRRTWWTCCLAHYSMAIKETRVIRDLFSVLPSTCGCCRVEVAAETFACRRTPPRWLHHRDWTWTLCLAKAPYLFTVWTSVVPCSVNDGRVVLTRMMRCLCVYVCEPPSPTSPSPPPTLHHMMAWVGLPLWVTQLWGAVLARPLSPVSEPRLMTADDDPVVFPPSHTPSHPASLHHPFKIFFVFFLFIYFLLL